MSTVDWTRIQHAKNLERERITNRTFAEKLETLDRLRMREAQMRALREIERRSNQSQSAALLTGHREVNESSAGCDRFFLLGADPTLVALMTADHETGTPEAQILFWPSKLVTP